MTKTIPSGKATTVKQRISPTIIIISPILQVRSLPSKEKMIPMRLQTSVKGNSSALIIQPIAITPLLICFSIA